MHIQDRFVDTVMGKLGERTDKALAQRLRVDTGNLCNIRRGSLKIGATFLVSVHEETGISIADLKELAGLPKAKPIRE